MFPPPLAQRQHSLSLDCASLVRDLHTSALIDAHIRHITVSLMPPARQNTKSRQIAQDDAFRGDGEDYDLEEGGSCSVTKRGSKSKAPRKVASKWKGKQSEKHNNVGKLSKLPDMPLDILYEVSYRTSSETEECLLTTIHSAFTDVLSSSPKGSSADVAG